MASRLEWFDVTVPAGTPIASPVTIPTSFPAGGVSKIQLHIPPGPAGTVGFQLWTGGGQFWPHTPGSWLILDNTSPEWVVDGMPNTGNWSVVAYNTDIYPHLIQVGFSVFENTVTTGSSSSQVPVSF